MDKYTGHSPSKNLLILKPAFAVYNVDKDCFTPFKHLFQASVFSKALNAVGSVRFSNCNHNIPRFKRNEENMVVMESKNPKTPYDPVPYVNLSDTVTYLRNFFERFGQHADHLAIMFEVIADVDIGAADVPQAGAAELPQDELLILQPSPPINSQHPFDIARLLLAAVVLDFEYDRVRTPAKEFNAYSCIADILSGFQEMGTVTKIFTSPQIGGLPTTFAQFEHRIEFEIRKHRAIYGEGRGDIGQMTAEEIEEAEARYNANRETVKANVLKIENGEGEDDYVIPRTLTGYPCTTSNENALLDVLESKEFKKVYYEDFKVYKRRVEEHDHLPLNQNDAVDGADGDNDPADLEAQVATAISDPQRFRPAFSYAIAMSMSKAGCYKPECRVKADDTSKTDKGSCKTCKAVYHVQCWEALKKRCVACKDLDEEVVCMEDDEEDDKVGTVVEKHRDREAEETAGEEAKGEEDRGADEAEGEGEEDRGADEAEGEDEEDRGGDEAEGEDEEDRGGDEEDSEEAEDRGGDEDEGAEDSEEADDSDVIAVSSDDEAEVQIDPDQENSLQAREVRTPQKRKRPDDAAATPSQPPPKKGSFQPSILSFFGVNRGDEKAVVKEAIDGGEADVEDEDDAEKAEEPPAKKGPTQPSILPYMGYMK